MRIVSRILIIGLLACGCINNKTEFEQIITIEDQRRPCEELLPFLQNTEPRIRTRAVEALARLQDTTCVLALIELLDDVNHNVRIETAFALGQTGQAKAEQALLQRLQKKDVEEAKKRILEALGKISGKASFPAIIQHLSSLEPVLRGEAALAIGRLAHRGIIDSTLTQSVTRLLTDSNANVRWKAAYALMRIGQGQDPKPLRKAIGDPDHRVRMYALIALGNLKGYTFIEPIGNTLSHDEDWHVRVKAANAFAKYPLSLSANYLSLLNQPQPVRVAIIRSIGLGALLEPKRYRVNSRELNFAKQQLEQVLVAGNGHLLSTQAEKGEALLAYARLMGVKAIDTLLQYANGSNVRLQARSVEALGEIGAIKVLRVFIEHYTDSTPPAVKIAILEALDKINGDGGLQIYLKALNENDDVLVALAAQGLARDSLKNKIYSKRIVEACKRLSGKIEIESAQMLFAAMARFREQDAVPLLEEALKSAEKAWVLAAGKALEKITGRLYEKKPEPDEKTVGKFDYSPIFNLEGAHALITTDRGQINLELLPQDAPLTVSNFVKLTNAGFYNGLIFHRVVPNFIIQGGDPRGDGWGSPGYTIRAEFNKNNYLRGTVGMASAGKDTEGSQFFITHSAQPHLDGRYTVFGRVVSGMNVVDEIQEGDVIREVAIIQ